jgi:hypothetical protein
MSILPTSNLRTSARPSKLVLFLAGFVCALALLFLLAHSPAIGGWLRSILGDLHIGMDQSAIVQRIQKLQRLETVKYTVEKVVTGERQSRFLPQSLAGERILMVVHGEVFAGVDLGKLKADDVRVNGKQVKITLPHAEIFSTRLDNDQTRVYSRETGLLVQADPNLESEVRADAERQILQAALIDGILGNASNNAQATARSLVQALGFSDVEVN